MSSKFKHRKYTWSKPFASAYHRWELVGPNGAVHFTASEPTLATWGYACGLEFHHLSGEGAPDHLNCPLTGGRCWHNGTSLYAEESVWPIVSGYLASGDHEQIFQVLAQEYEDYFDD